MIIVDTSALFALVDAAQEDHARVAAVIERERGPFLLSTFVLAELDYLLSTRLGIDAELDFLRSVAEGDYPIETFDDAEIAKAAALIERYRDLSIGLVDASIVVLADRADTRQLLTLDERHFRALRPLRGGSFRLLPADA
ncbi:MAG: PIN domain-containing protein [Candidatus Limnocylindria bacterium]|nr:PIN domain-containing protein [Candidatus Limnocylindria bacterium]